jgi:hypothetical protein
MKHAWKNPLFPSFLTHRTRVASLLGVCALIAFAFVLSVYSGEMIPSANAASTSMQTSASSAATGYPIKVFFSKAPDSLQTNFNAVFPVKRTSPTIAVATFSIQLLIAGPTLSEQRAGYFSELNTMLNGPSNCTGALPVGGPDFVITLNKRGPTPQTGTATIKFCRSLNSAGIGADARVQAEITATLKQFSNIKEVVILTRDGHCFGDESGKDFCLR